MRERSTAQEDVRTQRQVLQLVLHAYPELFTEGDLEREMANNVRSVSDRDAIARAVLGLVTVGLLHCCGPVVLPSRAALRIRRLEQTEES